MTLLLLQSPLAGIAGSLSLSGSGTLTLTGAANVAGAAALSGSGALTGAGSIPNAITPNGSGALTFSVVTLNVAGSVALSGSGTLTLSGASGPQGSVALSGSGTLTGVAGGLLPLSGSGTLTVTGVYGATGTVAFSGTGILGSQQPLTGWSADTTQQCTVVVVCSGVLTVDVPVAAAPAGVSVGTWRYSKTTMPTPTLDSKQRPVGWVPS